MNQDLRPLFGRVLVKPIAVESVSKGGIIIPENAKERSQSGVVVAVGPGNSQLMAYFASLARIFVNIGAPESTDPVPAEMPVSVGDVVMYGKFSGFEVGVENIVTIAGDEQVSQTETLVVLQVQEIMLARTPSDSERESLLHPATPAAAEEAKSESSIITPA